MTFRGCVEESISYMAYLRLDVSRNTPETRRSDRVPRVHLDVVVTNLYDVQSPSDMRREQVKATWSCVEGGSHEVVSRLSAIL